MPKPPPPDLFVPKFDGFDPLSGTGPRLWIRRLVIWSSQNHDPIRDIALRPGLNIVWSPDADADGSPMGHGGGKTIFCRLIRYCLGEDSFGNDSQRQRIAEVIPDARVGAEIMLDGELWNVIRPIGAGARSGRHCATRGGSLEALIQSDLPNPTMRPLREAIVNAIMPSAAPHMPVGSNFDDAWEASLGWMTRDQECRLRDVLEWRSPETQSRSPSRNMSKADRLRVVRLLLKALQQDEIDAARRAHSHKQRAEESARRKQRVEWLRDDVARDLHDIFGGNPADDASPDFWARRATAAASSEKLRADPEMEDKLRVARALVEKKDDSFGKTTQRLIQIDAVLPELTERLRIFSQQLPRAALRIQDASDPRCSTCGQSVDPEAKAFIAMRKAEFDELIGDQRKAEDQKNGLLAEQQAEKGNAALAQQQFDRAKAALTVLEQTAKSSADAIASATGYITLTKRYPGYLAEIARHDEDMKHALASEAGERRKADDSRLAAQGIVQRFSDLFHMIIRFLVPEGAEGKVLLSETGIYPVVGLHGDLSTAAVDSLKVVAFDLAALLLAMEGKTKLPGFWLHDSPREADLGLTIYHRLFELALWLENRTATPQFQYIVTTTTAPPDKLRRAPWCVLELSSAPSDRRLLKRDL